MHRNGTHPKYCSTLRTAAVLLALSAALGACIPAPYGTYLRPSYPDSSAVLTRAECGGQAGPPKNLSFSAPGEVKFTVSARRDQSEPAAGWLLSIRVEPAADSGFRFVSDTVEVANAAGAEGDRLRPKVLATSSQQLPANAWIDISRLGPTSQDIANRSLAAEGGLEIGAARTTGNGMASAAQRLRVILPALQTPRERFEVPPLDLAADAAATSGVQTLRGADYAQALAQREARCRAQTPERACENIRKHDPYSFRHESGPFTYLGRFWNLIGGKPEPLRFELEVQARTTEPWRIVEPMLRLQEDGGGAAQQRPLDRVNLTLRYPAPLDTRLRGTGAAMLIEVALPASDSRHFVQLPSYDVNGLRHRMQPIELEQRRFDGGLEPFDC